MKPVLYGILAACLVLPPSVALACPPLGYFPPPTYVPVVKEVVKEVVIPATFFVPVAVPTIQVGYAPPPALAPAPAVTSAAPPAVASAPAPVASGPSPCEQRVKELEARLAAMEARLAALAGSAPGAPPPPRPDRPEGPAPGAGAARYPMLTAKCLACHGATANVDGGPRHFSMLDATGQVSLSAAVAGRALAKAYSGDMPPKGNGKGIAPLTDTEVATLVQELSVFTK